MPPRPGARTLVLDPTHRVLLLHAHDPDTPGRHWWELPGGSIEPGESAQGAAARELAEETGHVVANVGPHLWTWEARYWLRGAWQHREHRVFLVRVVDPVPAREPVLTDSERAGFLELRWWTLAEIESSPDKFLPPDLSDRVAGVLRGLTRDEGAAPGRR